MSRDTLARLIVTQSVTKYFALFCGRRVHYHTHKSKALFPIVQKIDLVHSFTHQPFNIRFTVILPSVSMSVNVFPFVSPEVMGFSYDVQHYDITRLVYLDLNFSGNKIAVSESTY